MSKRPNLERLCKNKKVKNDTNTQSDDIKIVETKRRDSPIIKVIGEFLDEQDEQDEQENIIIDQLFSMKQRYKSFLVVDIGSSFSKTSFLDINGTSFVDNTVFFTIKKKTPVSFAKTVLYMDSNGRKYSLDKEEFENPKEIASIKKLFTVMDASTLKVGEFVKPIKHLMQMFIEQLFKSMNLNKRLDALKKIAKKYNCILFTVPTETPLHVKKRYKRVIQEAIKACFHYSSIDVYIIEEFLLLYYANISSCEETVSMIVDIGHLTTDTTILSNDKKILHANGEVGGIQVVHKAIMKEGFDSYMVMEKIFEDINCSSLPTISEDKEENKKLDKAIEMALHQVLTPLLDIIIQYKPTQVLVNGAIVSSEYFKTIVEKFLTEDQLKSYIESQELLQEEFKIGHTFETSCKEHAGSALIPGAINLIKRAMENDTSLDFDREFPIYKTHVGFIFEDTNKNLKMKILKNSYDMYYFQDIEIYLLKIRNTIDIQKAMKMEIDERNFKQFGIMEFERFSTVRICFPKDFKAIPCYFLVGEVDDMFVYLQLYYRKHNYICYTHKFKIPRKGRMERIPITDIPIIFSHEEEETTWYGSSYFLNLAIPSSSDSRIDINEIKSLTKEELEEMGNHLGTEICKLKEGDEEMFEKMNSAKCIACNDPLISFEINHKIENELMVKMARETFTNENIAKGTVMCRKCFKKMNNSPQSQEN